MSIRIVGIVCLTLGLAFAAAWLLRPTATVAVPGPFPTLAATDTDAAAEEIGIATFGNGCFWCTEAVFQQLDGVKKVVSGYSGGSEPNPTYERVSTGKTGHAEAIRIEFDPKKISYERLLEVFWRSHDPTTVDRQGNDVGSQYRSIVFAHSPNQERLARGYLQLLDAARVFPSRIVTQIVPFVEFYPAEAEHQNFFAANPKHGYCRFVIGPKLDKLRAVFQKAGE